MANEIKSLVDQYGQPLKSQRPAGDDRRRLAIRARYDAAQPSRHLDKHWSAADALGPLQANRPEVRAQLRRRSRYECLESNSYAKGIVLTLANDTIGTGPVLQMKTGDRARDRLIETAWRKWCKAVRFVAKLRTMRIAKAVDGETFARFVTNLKLAGPVKLDLIPYECDVVCDPEFPAATDERNADGVFLDELGTPVKYRVLRGHPGDSAQIFAGSKGWEDVDAAQMVHVFNVERAGQRRGIPETTPALPLFAFLRGFTISTVITADNAAKHTAVIQTTAASVDPDTNEENDFTPVDIESGYALTLPAGWTIEQIRAEHPATTYEMFKREILNEIARCFNMPYNVAACNSSTYNYSSGRLDHQIYNRAQEIERELWVDSTVETTFVLWLREFLAVSSGISPSSIDVERYAHQWAWDLGGHIDPMTEAQAQATRLNNHTTTLADELAKEGKDWLDVIDQRKREIDAMRAAGIPIPGAQPATQAPVSSEPAAANPDQRQANNDPKPAARR